MTKELKQLLIETAYMGAFYRMQAPTADIIHFFQMDHQPEDTQARAALGAALLLVGAGAWDEAASAIEDFLQDASAGANPELKVLLALAYKKGQKRADRVDALLEEVSRLPKETHEAVCHAASAIRAA